MLRKWQSVFRKPPVIANSCKLTADFILLSVSENGWLSSGVMPQVFPLCFFYMNPIAFCAVDNLQKNLKIQHGLIDKPGKLLYNTRRE